MTPNFSKPPSKVFAKKQNYFCWVFFYLFFNDSQMQLCKKTSWGSPSLQQPCVPNISQPKRGPNFLLPNAALCNTLPSTPWLCPASPRTTVQRSSLLSPTPAVTQGLLAPSDSCKAGGSGDFCWGRQRIPPHRSAAKENNKKNF